MSVVERNPSSACPLKRACVRLRGRSARGLTLIELMVSSVIILILILAVSQIISNARTVVNTSQAIMRANAKALAVETIIREDLRRASKLGFLAITRDPFSTDPSVMTLVFTAAGPSAPITGAITAGANAAPAGKVGNGTLVQIGQAREYGNANKVLYRTGWITNRNGPADIPGVAYFWTSRRDYTNFDLADFQVGSSDPNDPNRWIDWLLNPSVSTNPNEAPNAWLRDPNNPSGLKVHQANLTLTDIADNNWKILCPLHQSVNWTVEWTDGTVAGTGNLIWYGPTNPKGGPGNTFETASPYRAVWTSANQNNWPVALRIRFKLDDPTFPADFRDVQYEIICPVGQ